MLHGMHEDPREVAGDRVHEQGAIPEMMAPWLKRVEANPGTWVALDEPTRWEDLVRGIEAEVLVGLEVRFQPGQYKGGGLDEVQLVGDMNKNGGLCDDCNVDKDYVIAVRRVWKREL